MQAALVVLAAASKAKTSSSSFATLLIIAVFFVALYFLFLRPRAQRQRQARNQVRAAEVGDKIVTIGGLVGTIVSENDDEVTLSTGNGVEVTYLRQAIGRKLEPAEPTDTPAADGEFQGPPPGFDEHAEPEEHETT